MLLGKSNLVPRSLPYDCGRSGYEIRVKRCIGEGDSCDVRFRRVFLGKISMGENWVRY